MNKLYRIVVLIVVVLAVFAVIFLGRSGNESMPPAGTLSPPEAMEPATLPRLVDLGSDKCIPCQRMAPILEELEAEYAGRMEVKVIDVRKNPEAGREFGIRLIPTQIFFDTSGQELYRHEGFYAREDILAKWRELGVDLGDPAHPRAGDEG